MLLNTTLRPNKQRGQNAISLIYATAACFIISTLGEMIYDYTSDFFVIGAIAILQYLYSGVYLVSAVLFIMWFRRAYYNLNVAAHNTIYSDGWVAGFWFIPIVNLFRPYQLMKEMYNKTNDLLADDIKGCISQKSVSDVGLWWALWIISNIFNSVNVFFLGASSTTSIIGAVVDIIIFIPLTYYAAKVVRDYMEMEEVMQEMAETQRETELQN